MVSVAPPPRYKTVITDLPPYQTDHRTTVSTGYPVFFHTTTATVAQSTSPSSVFSDFICRLLTAASVALFLVSVVVLLLFLILRPKFPLVRVDSAELSEFNNSSGFPTRLSLTLLFQNPNRKVSLSYTDLDAFLRYGNESDVASSVASSTRLPPFTQATRELTQVKTHFEVPSHGIFAERGNNNGTVNFGVSVFATVRFSAGMLRSRDRSMEVWCYPVTVAFDHDKKDGMGTMVGPSGWCYLNNT